MNIEDYINKKSEKVSSGDIAAEAAAKTETEIEKEDHELTRKRDILASVALIDGLESYIGKNISAEHIHNMEKEKLESYFLLYQLKAGQEATNEMMTSLVEMSVIGLSYMVDIDNKEDLKNDLLNIKQLRRTIGRYAVERTEKYGDFVTLANVFFTVKKHLSISPKEDVGDVSPQVESTLEMSAPSTILPPADDF